jgi:hypothetical protein
MYRKHSNSLVDEKKAAEMMNVKATTLQMLRWADNFEIPYEYLNGKAYYRIQDCEKGRSQFAKHKGSALTPPLSNNLYLGDKNDSNE